MPAENTHPEAALPPSVHILTELEQRTVVYRAACSACGWRDSAYTTDSAPTKNAGDHVCQPFQSVAQLVKDGATYDGAHHKQWYLVQIARILGVELEDGIDEGMPA